MVSFSKLAELSSGNIGFAGGSAVDTMPGMSFSECANAFNDYLSEQAIADYEREEACDEQLFEAAVMAMQCGDSTILENAMTTLNESDDDSDSSSGSKSFWTRVKEFFGKIAAWFKNLALKATSWVNSFLLDGPAFWKKYEAKFRASKATIKIGKGYYEYGVVVKPLQGIEKLSDYISNPSDLLKNLDSFTDTAGKYLDDFIDGKFDQYIKDAVANAKDTATKIRKGDDDIDEAAGDFGGMASATDVLKNIRREDVENAIKGVLGCPEDKSFADFFRGKAIDSDTKASVSSHAQIIKDVLVLSPNPKIVKKVYETSKAVSADVARKVGAYTGIANNDIISLAKTVQKIYNIIVKTINSVVQAYCKALKGCTKQYKRLMRSIMVGKDIGEDSAEVAEGSGDNKEPEKEETPAAEGKEESVGFDGFDFDL